MKPPGVALIKAARQAEHLHWYFRCRSINFFDFLSSAVPLFQLHQNRLRTKFHHWIRTSSDEHIDLKALCQSAYFIVGQIDIGILIPQCLSSIEHFLGNWPWVWPLSLLQHPDSKLQYFLLSRRPSLSSYLSCPTSWLIFLLCVKQWSQEYSLLSCACFLSCWLFYYFSLFLLFPMLSQNGL